ncbi:synaptic vesicle glycoprotein 2C-like [Anticarsia gemmatalis]|uniref:synaptic vesicle glycoprotein 2C-like n=1 Tax=Anticarsia gemmatalis TaxID=129554 RepID=UPI003F759F97
MASKDKMKTVINDLGDLEMNSTGHKSSDKTTYSYEEALEITGHGKYNYLMLYTCFVVIIAMGIDIFGLGIIVTAATCDLGMTLSQIGVLSSMPFAGIIVMSYPWGYLSDTRGRRLVLMYAMCGSFISAALSSLAPNWQILAALRFISSAMSSAAESATYALLGECCGSRVRAKYMLLITSALMLTPTLYYITGYLIMKLDFTVYLLGIVYRPWRLLTLLMALPLGVSTLCLWYFSESPKFLANVGRGDEAVEVLKRMYVVNGKSEDKFPIKQIFLEDGSKEAVGDFSFRSLWNQIAPLFKPPLFIKTFLLFYLTFVTYIANNSFAIILPTIFNIFFTSYATSVEGASFCDLFKLTNSTATAEVVIDYKQDIANCKNGIEDNTIWAGCAHGLSFFVLNALISQCASKRKILTIIVLVIAAAAAIGIESTGEAISGLILFYVFLTTAMVFGVISSYFVDLYPTSYRGMVACLGMMVARLSAFAGTNIISGAMTTNCSTALYGGAGIVLSGAIAAFFLPSDSSLAIN